MSLRRGCARGRTECDRVEQRRKTPQEQAVTRHDPAPGSQAREQYDGPESRVCDTHADLFVVFLGSDASVKLGDFGLSKIMQSHDFASTYVGTPFYMSPEICAAEQYSLHSDIWALGCIMYELCAKEPPFNAKTHLELIQRIRLGKITPLSHVYSTELKESISRCLKVNPMMRPDTVQLLNIPMVKLKRKELEIVRVSRHLKAKEEQTSRAMKDIEQRMARLDADKQSTRLEIDHVVRREWELKARLEIDRQVQVGMERLYKGFESEVGRRVAEEVKKMQSSSSMSQPRSLTPNGEDLPQNIPLPTNQQSQSTSGETDDFPSSTDLSELSLESPTLNRSKSSAKGGRTPFARAQTMFDGSPDDVPMVDPSPAPIASLNLSPRRNGSSKPSSLRQNIFATASSLVDPSFNNTEDEADDDEDTDEVPALPSPTRVKAQNDPFKAQGARRPTLLRQKTAPQKKANQSNLFNAASKPASHLSRESSQPQLTKHSKPPTSPNRRLTKLPSASNLINDAGSPSRKAPAPPSTSPTRNHHQPQSMTSRPPSRKKTGDDDMRHAAMVNSHVQGRTLVELAQARGGGGGGGVGVAVQDFGGEQAETKKGSGGATGEVENILGLPVTEKQLTDAGMPVWDPERDEMPSPFLVKAGRGLLSGVGTGAPGMRHLR